ncbi:Xaa-Pro aminopeptidase [Saccharospirillum sp. MSK14-1]|uniref:Xaa-Pro aminopeptidase n=1 Tax=Saccharospirillum sp. MSK14-1 TaxID=1897632 RepID=UPI000D39C7CB|nr:Xaa-Pro aminopeptidase [Saccharospirillum sp. MSK14-1]PTY37472.1 Xaa-Pro aminopeptidase [Saccharospirillum sp. MSK14-1]
MTRISRTEFAERRQQLMEQLAPGSIAIIPGASETIRNNDVHHPFRQNSDFMYLTGFAEPDAVAVLVPGREAAQYILFVRDKDPEREIWDGYRAGPEGAVADYDADDAFPIDDIDDILPGLMEGRSRVYSHMGVDAGFDHQLMAWVNQIRARVRLGARPPEDFSDIAHLLHDQRLVKSEQEIAIMREAAQLSARAHKRAMQACQPGVMEYQLQAEIEHECMLGGSPWPAYPAIVGAGDHACVLHYIENAAPIKDGDLVLIDAGGELEYYASDITRTFPANGRFSEEQRTLYDLVLRAQLASIEAVKPGATWIEPHEATVRVLTEGLVELGLLKGDVDTLIEHNAIKPFYMHKTGHWLGMDVHDVGDYKVGGEWRVLEPGMVLTIEPGLYISPNNTDVDEKWRGIGIRIEDDVVVTRNGCEILSADVPKDPTEIEALMASSEQRLS